MKKLRCLLFVLLLFLTINVNASSDCEVKELNRLKELAKKVEFDYDYKLVDNKAVFSINAVNLNEELKVLIIEDYYNSKFQEFKGNAEHKATINNFEEGKRVPITIKAFVANWCSGETVLTKTIKLPYYNYYYDADKCENHEDFKYCKLLIDSKISKEQFDKQYDQYLKNKENNNRPIDDGSNSNMKLYLIIGGSVLGVALVTVLVRALYQRKKKNSL